MIRKLLHILLAVFIIAISLGFNINKHYCSDKLVSVTIASDKCNSCCYEESDKCCVTKTKYLQLEELFLSGKIISLGSSTIIPTNHFTNGIIQISNCENNYTELHYPPPLATSIKLSLKQSYLL